MRHDIIMYAVVLDMVLIFLMNREYSTLHALFHTDINEVPRKESIGEIKCLNVH